MDKVYLSFGPNCLSAEILRSCQLRERTYGFDWFRSGSWHHREFLRNSTDDFLKRYVLSPNVPMVQTERPEQKDSKTVELQPKQMIYGYNILYNPHRYIYERENIEYFRRSFQRLKLALAKHDLDKTVILSDYTNKPGNHVIKNIHTSTNYLTGHLCLGTPNVRLVFCSLSIGESTESPRVDEKIIMNGIQCKIIKMIIGKKDDEDKEKRRERYSALKNLINTTR